MRIIFLNRFFHPDLSATSQMLSDLAFTLAADSRPVTVITSRQRYDAPGVPLAPRETVAGVDVARVWTSRFGRQNLIGRSFDYLSFYLTAAWRLFWLAKPGDIVVAKTDPPMLAVIAHPIARLRGAKFINWLQDIFPEVALALGVGTGLLPRMIFAVLRRFRDGTLRRADANVVIGTLMAKRLAVLKVPSSRISLISNWADGALLRPVDARTNPLRASWGLDGQFVVGYSGNLGRAHEYATLIDAIQRLEKVAKSTPKPAISWLFIGGGAMFEEFKNEVQRLQLTSVQFRPYQPKERLAESLSAADVHLVSLRAELEGLIVPSKFYGIAAAGRPTVFIGAHDGEIGQILLKHNCGVTVPSGDGEQLAKTIMALAIDTALLQAMGDNALEVFRLQFDKPIAMQRWRDLLMAFETCTYHRNERQLAGNIAPEKSSRPAMSQ